jgi:hypothetical protein
MKRTGLDALGGREDKLSMITSLALWLFFCDRVISHWSHLTADIRFWSVYQALVFPLLWISILRRNVSVSFGLASAVFFASLIPLFQFF